MVQPLFFVLLSEISRLHNMNLKINTIACLLAISAIVHCQTQTEINVTDSKGMKQGHWIKKYPEGSTMYDGIFKDDHPTGEFKRFNEDKTLKSVLIYSNDGKEAYATIYHPNGFISSRGKYFNQMKEGKWQFFSSTTEGYLLCEETYSNNLRNGLSLKFYPDSTVAEQVNYRNDIKQGAWIQYYANGAICLKSNYLNDKINGPYEVLYENGSVEFSGCYKNNVRDSTWLIFNKDGSVKYKIEYQDGITKDRQMDIDESDLIDLLEKNKGKIADPEKSGMKW
jgi:antitoxin component YwqK of YwqJK toxin-antitoxin module